MSVLQRWTAKLAARRKLLDRARRSVIYWGRRAGSVHGRHMLTEARARYELRKTQVAYAEKVVERHRNLDSVTPRGLALIAGFEGFRSNPYRDAVGVWTIGYGETRGIGPNTKPWSRAFALQQLRIRVDRDYLAPVLKVAKSVGLELRPNESDALASLVYNLGPGILEPQRTMGAALRSKNRRAIANAFLVYDKAGGRTLPGLTRRRRAERALFLS